MAIVTKQEQINLLRPYITYKPPVIPRLTGPIAVSLYTDGELPDAFYVAYALGRKYSAHVQGALIALTLELRQTGGAVLTQNSTSAQVRNAFERAVLNIGWTKVVYTPPYE